MQQRPRQPQRPSHRRKAPPQPPLRYGWDNFVQQITTEIHEWWDDGALLSWVGVIGGGLAVVLLACWLLPALMGHLRAGDAGVGNTAPTPTEMSTMSTSGGVITAPTATTALAQPTVTPTAPVDTQPTVTPAAGAAQVRLTISCTTSTTSGCDFARGAAIAAQGQGAPACTLMNEVAAYTGNLTVQVNCQYPQTATMPTYVGQSVPCVPLSGARGTGSCGGTVTTEFP